MATITTTALTDDMLAHFDERAPVYDRENRFFDEDFEELKASRLPRGPCPTELGGSGLGLDEYTQLQRRHRLRRAGHRALAMNMHCYWMGVAADLLRAGDDSCRWMLEEARGRRGLLRAPRRGGQRHAAAARRRDRRPGRRRLGDLGPQDLRQPLPGLGLRRLPRHGQRPIPANPQIVHGFLPRDTSGYPDHRHVGHARDAGDPEPGHRARQGVRARRAHRRWCARRVRRRRAVPGRRSSPGRSWASPPSTSARPSGRST